jgi:predicted permease
MEGKERPPAPPRLARRILAVLAGRRRSEVEPALSELFVKRAELGGAREARRWYRRQVIGFALRWRALDGGGGGMGTMETWTRDVRLAARSLARAPGFAAVAVLTFALGIGANTAIFSVIHGSLLAPLPYDHPDGLVWLSDGHPSFGVPRVNQSIPNFLDLRAGSRLLRSAAVYRVLDANLSSEGEAARVAVLWTSSEMLGVLGVAPTVGRDLLPSDDDVGAEPVAMLTDDLWRSRFGADPSVVGTTTIVDARPVRIAGVLPASFSFPGRPRLVMPLQHVGAHPDRGSRGYFGIGRLAEGTDVAALRDELQGIFDGLVRTYPDANEGWYTWATPLRESIVGRNRRSLLLLGGAVALVLLIACVNVANLLLVRAERRHRELAVRYSLGAQRSGMISLFLGEGLILALAGGLLGVAAAYWGVDVLVALYGDALARADTIGLNGSVLAFALAVTLLVGVLVGLVPLVRIRPDRLQTHLKDGARGSSGQGGRTGRILVVAEVALSVLVVSAAGLLANSMWRLQQVDLGVRDPDRVMTFTMSLPATSYPDAPSMEAFVEGLDARIAAVPGVRAVGLVNRLPLLGGDNMTMSVYGDETRFADFTSVRYVTPGYFAAVGVPLLEGRWLTPDEFRGSTTSVVINETLARKLFGGEDPIGGRIAWGPVGLVVVGVCADLAGGNADGPAPPAFYHPFASVLRLWVGDAKRPPGDYVGVSALVRTEGDPHALVSELRDAVRSVDLRLPLDGLKTLQDIAVDRLGTRRFALSLFGVFAALALLLGAIGIYGVMSFGVAQRSRELGMRLALGASRASVLRMVLARGARLTGPGLLLGLAAAMGSARLLGDLLYEVSPLDPWTYALVAAVLATVSIAATWLPAWRATRLDPAESLRGE